MTSALQSLTSHVKLCRNGFAGQNASDISTPHNHRSDLLYHRGGRSFLHQINACGVYYIHKKMYMRRDLAYS